MKARSIILWFSCLLVLFSCNLKGKQNQKSSIPSDHLEKLYQKMSVIDYPALSRHMMSGNEIDCLPDEIKKISATNGTYFFALGKYETVKNGVTKGRSIIVQIHQRKGNSVRTYQFKDKYFLVQLKDGVTPMNHREIGEFNTIDNGILVSSDWLDDSIICIDWEKIQVSSAGILPVNKGKKCYQNNGQGQMGAEYYQDKIHGKL